MKPIRVSKVLHLATMNDYRVEFIFTDDVQAIGKALNFEPSDTANACHIFNHMRSWIVLPIKAEPGTIAHECWHCAKRALEGLGAGLDNEVVAYLLTYLVDEAHKLQPRAKAALQRRTKQKCRKQDSKAGL